MPAPLCRYCGTPIKKTTTTVYLRDRPLQSHEQGSSWSRYLVVDKLPSSIEECRKLTNRAIVSIKRHHDPERNAITFFSEWDGTSYVDEFFCNGSHARLFGYAAARAGHVMAAWQVAFSAQKATAE